MRKKLFRLRQWGFAAAAAGLALGAVTAVGEGVSAAATTVSATVGTVPSAVAGGVLFTTPASTAPITITLSAAPAASDTVELILSCTSGLEFSGSAAISPAGWTVNAASSNNACGAGVNNIETFSTDTSTSATVTPKVTTVSASTIPASGNVTLTVEYIPAAGTTSPSTTTTTTVLTVNNGSITESPVPTVATNSKNTAINPVTINFPTAATALVGGAAGTGYICLTLPLIGSAAAANLFDNFNGKPPTVTLNTGQDATSFTIGTPVLANVNATNNTSIQQDTWAVPLTSTAVITTAPSFTFSGLYVDGNTAGVQTATFGYDTTTSCNAPVAGSGTSLSPASSVFTVGTSTAAIYGADGTTDGTAAAEFEAANINLKVNPPTCNPSYNAVLATAASNAQGADAYSGAYLESYLQAGVLITQPTTLSANTLAALKLTGVERVYILGGPLAITQAVITQLQSTPSYNCGGLTARGFNLQVFGPIYGTTADDTAAAIDNYVPKTYVGTASFAAAYSAATSTTGGGLYNQTAGSASATGPTTTPAATALVVSDTDYADAMAAAGLSYSSKFPVILTPATALGTQASTELTTLGIKQVIALGGNLALTNSVVTAIQALGIPVLRIAGADYTQTAADIAQFEAAQLGWKDATVLVAQGAYWSDAISAAQLSAGWSAGTSTGNMESILLTEGPTQGVGQYTDAVLKLAGTPPTGLGSGVTTSIQVLGGPLAVTAAQLTEMQSALASGA